MGSSTIVVPPLVEEVYPNRGVLDVRYYTDGPFLSFRQMRSHHGNKGAPLEREFAGKATGNVVRV